MTQLQICHQLLGLGYGLRQEAVSGFCPAGLMGWGRSKCLDPYPFLADVSCQNIGLIICFEMENGLHFHL